ncbi:MAG: hypothetical protein JST55_04920 [Bacteroidetes bacterium]|nr:hypothetical protein [Bacteroidota bacterium]
MKFDTIGKITDKMLELEAKHDLLNWELKGVKIYQVVRYLIYINAINSNIEQKGKGSVLNSGLFSKILNKASRLKNFFFYNPLKDKQQIDTLLFESSRKQKINNEYIDPFTASIKLQLKKSNSEYTVYQSSYFFDRLSVKTKNTKHLDYFFLTVGYKSKSFKLEFTQEELDSINKLGKELKTNLNLTLNLLSLIKNQLINFFILSGFYSQLLEIKKPKQIYIVNFCDKAALISECKKRKIQVIDIQHGFVSSKDIIYHYPASPENKLDYFPDKFLAWSESWLGGCKLPLSSDNIEYIENYTLKTEAEKYKGVAKIPNKVLILSQDTLTERILDNIFGLVKDNPKYNFFYKPHPNEYTFISGIKKYEELSGFKNFTTIGINENLYSHLSDGKKVIGVYTTALIEALYFNCEIFVIDLPGAEMMDNLIQSGTAKKLENIKLP